ncbi:MAG: hypothetical protein ACR2MG_21165 [Pyrinomonadaceae bacterium]
MNLLLKIILVISAFKAVVVLFLLVGAIAAWLNGAGSILLPGLGLIISIQMIIILLLMTEIFLVAIIAILWRFISRIRLK